MAPCNAKVLILYLSTRYYKNKNDQKRLCFQQANGRIDRSNLSIIMHFHRTNTVNNFFFESIMLQYHHLGKKGKLPENLPCGWLQFLSTISCVSKGIGFLNQEAASQQQGTESNNWDLQTLVRKSISFKKDSGQFENVFNNLAGKTETNQG